MKNPIVSATTMATVLVLCACGGAPKKVDSLEAARANYTQASANEVVVKHAAVELDDARKALSQADRAWKKDGKLGRAEHYAYIASQKVKIAKLIAQRNEDDKRLEAMNFERQRVQLDVRSQEIDRARKETDRARKETLEAREQTLAMQQQLEDMQARVTARGIVATLGDVLFDSGEAGLKASSSVNIDKIANFMNSFPDRDAVVEGHTDSMGDADYNLDLSRQRASSVRAALVARDISPSRITTRNLGESTPIADNSSAAGRQQNRRVEIVFPDDSVQFSNLVEQ